MVGPRTVETSDCNEAEAAGLLDDEKNDQGKNDQRAYIAAMLLLLRERWRSCLVGFVTGRQRAKVGKSCSS